MQVVLKLIFLQANISNTITGHMIVTNKIYLDRIQES